MRARIRREQQTLGTLPEIGKIKTGVKVEKPGGKSYPKGLDYFVATGKYASKFNLAYPGRPDNITVTFASDDPEFSCSERYELRDQSGARFAFGDGETFQVWDKRGEGQYRTVSVSDQPDIMAWCESQTGTAWAVTLDLRFLIPKVDGVFGVWHYRTKGELSSIPAIRDTFDRVLESAGTVVGVPFDLQVKFAKSQKPGSKSRYPVTSLVANLSQESLDTVNQLVKSGDRPRGLLTEQVIRDSTQRQIGSGTQYEMEVGQ